MSVRPLKDRIIVQRIEEGEQRVAGIIVPDYVKEKPTQGKVIAAGGGKSKDDGDRVALDVKAGDHIIFGKYSGQEINLDGDEYVIMREDEVFDVIGRGPQTSVSLDHAAQMLGVSRRTIYNRIREGRLQTHRTPAGSQRVLLEMERPFKTAGLKRTTVAEQEQLFSTPSKQLELEGTTISEIKEVPSEIIQSQLGRVRDRLGPRSWILDAMVMQPVFIRTVFVGASVDDLASLAKSKLVFEVTRFCLEGIDQADTVFLASYGSGAIRGLSASLFRTGDAKYFMNVNDSLALLDPDDPRHFVFPTQIDSETMLIGVAVEQR